MSIDCRIQKTSLWNELTKWWKTGKGWNQIEMWLCVGLSLPKDLIFHFRHGIASISPLVGDLELTEWWSFWDLFCCLYFCWQCPNWLMMDSFLLLLLSAELLRYQIVEKDNLKLLSLRLFHHSCKTRWKNGGRNGHMCAELCLLHYFVQYVRRNETIIDEMTMKEGLTKSFIHERNHMISSIKFVRDPVQFNRTNQLSLTIVFDNWLVRLKVHFTID